MSLKSLAERVISRNQQRNMNAARSEFACNSMPDNGATLLRAVDAAVIASTGMTRADERAISQWLTSIGEDDPVVFRETLEKCETNPDALTFFLGLARGENAGAMH